MNSWTVGYDMAMRSAAKLDAVTRKAAQVLQAAAEGARE
jgi:hypothetical protein